MVLKSSQILKYSIYNIQQMPYHNCELLLSSDIHVDIRLGEEMHGRAYFNLFFDQSVRYAFDSPSVWTIIVK